ncbi:MAG: succinate dehydrogenase, hydrophobic membrane anchor protein [Alphaproteobacteria bacterium]
MAQFRPAIGRVNGLGSAKEGTHHFWIQRLTAIALVPLTLWFVASIASLAGADLVAVKAWLGSPVAALLMLAFLISGFWHLKLGIQVVIEDYVHGEAMKLTALVLNSFICILLGGASCLAVLSLFLGA